MAKTYYSKICPHCSASFQTETKRQICCSHSCARLRSPKRNILLRLLENISIDSNNCWNWTKSMVNTGYGVIGSGRRTFLAHRTMWESIHGELAPTEFVLHKCDNRKCINPNHLFVGTHSDNMADMVSKNRHSHGDRHSQSKLTEDQVREIKKSSSTNKEEAIKNQVTPSLISKIRHSVVWSHVR